MDTSNNETEKGQEQPFFSETIPDQATFPASPSPLHPKRKRRWIVIISTVVIVLLLTASVSAIVMLGGRPTPTPKPTATATAPTTATPTPTTPPRGQWVQVLNDYQVTLLAAAPSQPNVLYACSVPPGQSDNMASVQTVLRSDDFGTHWQDIGSRAQISRGCDLAINPARSDEIFVVSTSSHAPTDQTVVSSILKHTSDGGKTWETIHSTVSAPGLNTALDWDGGQLRFAGNRLYSLQGLPIPPTPTPQGPPLTALTRLLMSEDGGHTWNVLDTQFAATGQFAADYAVNPANPTILYELAGLPRIPGERFTQFQLYKSIDSGQTWQPLPQTPISIGEIEISEDPNLIYLMEPGCPTSQASHTGGGPLVQQGGGSFSLCASKDGGKSWKSIISPDQFYTMSGQWIDRQGRLYAEGILSGSVQDIWRYDPTPDTWSKVAQTPSEGYLLTCTSAGNNDTTVLWFKKTGQVVLSRYIL